MTNSGLDEARLRRLIDAGRSLVSHLELEPVLDELLETARELTGARYAALGVLDKRRRELERFITKGIDSEAHKAIGDLPRGRGVLGVLISDPKPLRLANVGGHPRSYGFPPAHPEMRSFLGVPVLIRGEAWGNLYLTEKEAGEEFTETDEAAIVVLADWASIAIDNARLYEGGEERREELERAVHGLRATTEIARAVGGETDLEKVLELIAKRGRALVEGRTLLILLEEGTDLVVAASAGERRDQDAADRVPIDGSLSGRVFRSGRPELVSDVTTGFRVPPSTLGVEATTALVVPMTFRGRASGILVAFDRLSDGPGFTPEDEELLVSFAASAATAVHTARSVAEDRLRHSIAATEHERRRWARELHDETLQGLAALKVGLDAARSGNPARLDEAVGEAVEQLGDNIAALRNLITELRPAALDELGLGAAIESLADRVATLEGLEVDLSMGSNGGIGALPRLPPEVESTVYRLVQEALTNVAKHARADRAWVSVAETPAGVEVSVRDDGIGFDARNASGGYGLLGMRERVELAGGKLEIQSTPGEGSSVLALVPLSPT
jgi:two-component system, NarL family, sensor histidine kinase DevS